MGNIDLSDLLSDPDFVDPIVIIHRKTFVDEYGQNNTKETSFNTYGSVQAIDGKTLLRIPEALRVQNIMHFFVRGAIVSNTGNKYPDLLAFRGSRYAVQHIFDWTNWGDGWCEGVCVVENPTS